MALVSRQPYQQPRYQTDEDFNGSRKTEVYRSVRDQNDLKDSGKWSRLHSTRTLSSVRRSTLYQDRQAPRDSLDFQLQAEYNNHRELFKDRNEVVLQRETLGDVGNKQLKNRSVTLVRVEPELGHPLRKVCSVRKEDKNSIKNTISGHHTQTTNVGYSRKPDGGFYTS